jgi:hypothetical protein
VSGIRYFAGILMIACAMTACGGSCLERKVQDTDRLLNGELKIGDSRQTIESVLTHERIGYSYDKYMNRYQSNVYYPQCGNDQSVSIYIHLDQSGKLAKIEAFASYTGL